MILVNNLCSRLGSNSVCDLPCLCCPRPERKLLTRGETRDNAGGVPGQTYWASVFTALLLARAIASYHCRRDVQCVSPLAPPLQPPKLPASAAAAAASALDTAVAAVAAPPAAVASCE